MSEIPEDIKEAARSAADAQEGYYKYGGTLETIEKAIWSERQRAIDICSAEREWGGNIRDAQERIEKGEKPRQIEGWNFPYEEE